MINAPERSNSLPYVAPFVAFILFLALDRVIEIPKEIQYPLRFAFVTAVLLFVSRRVISFRMVSPVWSILIGIAVFVIWIGPDVLWPAYRSHWLFDNGIIGKAVSSVPADSPLRRNVWFIIMRVSSATLLVPIIEELFWRAWMMRWLVSKDFERVPLGEYHAQAFWIVAVLFASEHGAYWDVGFVTGAIYNWWMVRTRSLGDCILMHAVTNGCLSAYVLAADQWQYWF